MKTLPAPRAAVTVVERWQDTIGRRRHRVVRGYVSKYLFATPRGFSVQLMNGCPDVILLEGNSDFVEGVGWMYGHHESAVHTLLAAEALR